ncbi:MAG: hypothetical protein FWF94_01400 [Oscillospiraceae bacterium]|nr:hypothetical protein [Oscillospiraceae bacterium]
MDMESMAKLMQVLMSSDNSGGTDSAAEGSDGSDSSNQTPNNGGGTEPPSDNAANDGGVDFSGIFDSIDFDMLSKMGELFSRMNKPDRNAELLSALKPHLRIENQHKVDSALKLSRMMSMLPFLKESGILNDLF